MKKLIFILISCLPILFLSTTSQAALQAEGKIDEVKICGSLQNNMRHLTFVRLSDGNWFYLMTNQDDNELYDDPYSFQLIMHAYTHRLAISVSATHPPYTGCGITAYGFSAGVNDSLSLKRPHRY